MNMPAPLKFDLRESTLIEQPAIFRCQMTQSVRLSETVLQVLLTTPAGFPSCQAGQYIELQSEDGTARPFSVANFSPDGRSIELHIEERPDSQALCGILQQLADQGAIDVKPPAGDVRLRPASGPQIFLAAGTGFAQIKSLLEACFAGQFQNAEDPQEEAPLYLFWGADQPDQRYMEQQVTAWCERFSRLRYRPLNWLEGASWEAAVADEITPLHSCQVYACGSPQRVYQALAHLEDLGLPSDRMQSDVFAYAPRPAKAS